MPNHIHGIIEITVWEGPSPSSGESQTGQPQGGPYHDVALSRSGKREVVGGLFNPAYAHVKARLDKAKVKYKRVMRLMGRDSVMTLGGIRFRLE